MIKIDPKREWGIARSHLWIRSLMSKEKTHMLFQIDSEPEELKSAGGQDCTIRYKVKIGNEDLSFTEFPDWVSDKLLSACPYGKSGDVVGVKGYDLKLKILDVSLVHIDSVTEELATKSGHVYPCSCGECSDDNAIDGLKGVLWELYVWDEIGSNSDGEDVWMWNIEFELINEEKV